MFASQPARGRAALLARLPVSPTQFERRSALRRAALLSDFPACLSVCLSFRPFFSESTSQLQAKRVQATRSNHAVSQQASQDRADRPDQPTEQKTGRPQSSAYSPAQLSPVQHSTALQTQAGRKACIAPFFPLLSTHLPLPFPSVSVYITDCEREPPELPFIASSSPSVRRAATTTWHKRECGLHPLPL